LASFDDASDALIVQELMEVVWDGLAVCPSCAGAASKRGRSYWEAAGNRSQPLYDFSTLEKAKAHTEV